MGQLFYFTMLVRTYTSKQKMNLCFILMSPIYIITDAAKITFKTLYEDCVLPTQEKWSQYQQFLISMNGNWIFRDFRRPKKILSNPVVGSLYICNLKIKTKLQEKTIPDIYLFKFNNRNNRKRCQICPKLTIKIPARRHWLRPGVFIVDLENISQLFLVLLLLIWTNNC